MSITLNGKQACREIVQLYAVSMFKEYAKYEQVADTFFHAHLAKERGELDPSAYQDIRDRIVDDVRETSAKYLADGDAYERALRKTHPDAPDPMAFDDDAHRAEFVVGLWIEWADRPKQPTLRKLFAAYRLVHESI